MYNDTLTLPWITGIDLDTAKQFQSILKRQGMDFKLDTKVTGAVKNADGSITVHMDSAKGGTPTTMETGQWPCERILSRWNMLDRFHLFISQIS